MKTHLVQKNKHGLRRNINSQFYIRTIGKWIRPLNVEKEIQDDKCNNKNRRN